MIASSQARKLNFAPSSRPIIEAPGLRVVPTPAAARGFVGTVVVCALLFFGALATAFYLNTLMVAGAYKLKDISVEHNEAAARVSTLTSEVIEVSSPSKLRQSAQLIGMVPAKSMFYIDAETGAIIGQPEGTK